MYYARSIQSISILLFALGGCPNINICGDGTPEQPEECDDGNTTEGDGCDTNCTFSVCGNGITAGGEGCDDANNGAGDGCRDDCTQELCGDSILDPQEQCDDGNNAGGDGCRLNCTQELCGDSILDPQEDCDDGNQVDLDGCAVNCLVPSPQVSAGNFHTCALLETGNVRCWGLGFDGRLGYGNTNTIGDDETPASAGDVNVGGSVIQLVTGGGYTCALLATGNVRCWGSGALGYGNTNTIGDDETPASAGDVNVGGTVIQLAGNGGHNCALLSTGAVRCWGSGVFGALGYGNANDIGDDETPASAGDVNVGGAVIQVAAGDFHTCALLETGNVRCWGSSVFGALGYGNTNDIGDDELPFTAGDVNVGGFVVQLDAGNSHTCALLNTGNIRCWGNGGQGRLGYNGNTINVGDNETPASAGDVTVGGRVLQLALGQFHTCALLEAGSVRCWGAGSQGQLGYGNTNIVGIDESPADAGDVNVGAPVVQLGAGGVQTCAVLSTGNVRCWGGNSNGELGYGNTTNIGDDELPFIAGDVDLF